MLSEALLNNEDTTTNSRQCKAVEALQAVDPMSTLILWCRWFRVGIR